MNRAPTRGEPVADDNHETENTVSITPDAITQTLVARETIAAGECVTASGHIARAPEDVFAVATAGAIAGKSLTCTTSGAALLAWDTTQIIDRGDWLTCTAEGIARRAEPGDTAIARALEPARGTRLYALLTLAPQGTGSGGGSGGVTPNITATASVDDTSGTPAVTVTKSGTQAAPVLSFAFTGLRGADGAPGRDGRDGADGAPGKDGVMTFDDLTPEQKASLKGDPGEPGAKGDKGDKGDPADPALITLASLSDVAAPSPVNGQVLTFDENKWQPRPFAAAGFPGLAALDWKDPLSLGMTKGSLPIASSNTGDFKIAKFQNQVFFKVTSVQIQGNLSLPKWYSIFLNVPAEYLPPWNNELMPMQTWGPANGGSIVTFCAGNEPPVLWIIPTSWNNGTNYLHGIVTWYV